jgi:uncharacterized protein YwgA
MSLFNKYKSYSNEFSKAADMMVDWGLLYEKRNYKDDEIWKVEYKLTQKGKRALWAGHVTRELQPLLTERMQLVGFMLSYAISITALIVAICK